MYATVPNAVPGMVNWSSLIVVDWPNAPRPSTLASPKSSTSAWPRSVMKILADLMLRWMMPRAWAASRILNGQSPRRRTKPLRESFPPETFSERYFLPILLLHPIRCERCFRQDYRATFAPVSSSPVPAKKRCHCETRCSDGTCLSCREDFA